MSNGQEKLSASQIISLRNNIPLEEEEKKQQQTETVSVDNFKKPAKEPSSNLSAIDIIAMRSGNKKPVRNTEAIIEPKNTFNKEVFNQTIGEISTELKESLSNYYKTDNIEVIANPNTRSLKEQAENVKKGASKSAISVHNFGAGADFQIKIDGKTITATGKNSNIEESTVPYQILGGIARKKGLFWGWEWDSGHVGQTRFVHQFIEQNPDYAFSEETKTFYELNKDSAPASAKQLLENLDKIYNKTSNRQYIGNELTESTLLEPVYTDSLSLLVNSAVAKQENKNPTDIALDSEIQRIKLGEDRIDTQNIALTTSPFKISDNFIGPKKEIEKTEEITTPDETELKDNENIESVLNFQDIQSLAKDIRTNGNETYNLPDANLSAPEIVRQHIKALRTNISSSPESNAYQSFEETVREYIGDEGRENTGWERELFANTVVGAGMIAMGLTEYAMKAGKAVFDPNEAKEFGQMTLGMLSMMVDDPANLLVASGLNPLPNYNKSTAIGRQRVAEAQERVWSNPIAPLASVAGYKYIPRQLHGAKVAIHQQAIKAEAALGYLKKQGKIDSIVNLDPKVKFTPEEIALAEKLADAPEPFVATLEKAVVEAKQLEIQFQADSGIKPPVKRKKSKKTQPNDVLPLDEPLNPNPPKPTDKQIAKAKKAEKTRFEKRREAALQNEQSLITENIQAIESQLKNLDSNLTPNQITNLQNALKRSKEMLLEIHTEMQSRGMNVVEYLEAGFPITKSQATWVKNKILKGGQLTLSKFNRYLESSMETGPFKFSKNNQFWTPETDQMNARIRWQYKQNKLNNMAAEDLKGARWDNFMENWVDINWKARKSILKSDASGAVKDEALMNLQLVRGANAASAYEIEQFVKKVEKGLKTNDIETLNAYIQGWREIEIYKRNQEILRTVPDELKKLEKEKNRTKEISDKIKDAKKKIKEAENYQYSLGYVVDPVSLKLKVNKNGDKIVDDPYTTISMWQGWIRGVALENPIIHEKAMMVFSKYKTNLKELFDGGIFDESSFSSLDKFDYQKKRYIEKMKEYNGEMRKLGTDAITVQDNYIRALKSGSPGALDNSYRMLMADAINMKYNLLFENQANLSLAKLINEIPDNGFAMFTKKGSKIPKNWKVIEYLDNGKSKAIALRPDMYQGWITQKPQLTAQAANLVHWLTGSKILKMGATGYNPGFAFKNFFRDISYTYFRSNEYNPVLPLFLLEIGADYAQTATSAFFRKGAYVDYMHQGGGMSLLTNQGQLRFGDAYGGFVPFAKQRTKARGALNTLKSTLGYVGETSEIWTRLAIRNRALKNKRTPKQATWIARNNMDFGGGGAFTKTLDHALPYVNAQMVAVTGLAQSAKKNPGIFAAKAAQVAFGSGGLYMLNQENGSKAYNHIHSSELYNYHIVMIPGTEGLNDDGLFVQKYWRFPKDTATKGIGGIMEMGLALEKGDIVGGAEMREYVFSTLSELGPVELSRIVPPTMAALLGFQTNQNSYTGYELQSEQKNVRGGLKRTYKEPEYVADLADYTNSVLAGVPGGFFEGVEVSPAQLKNAFDELAITQNDYVEFFNKVYTEAKVKSGFDIKSYKNKDFDKKSINMFIKETSGIDQKKYSTIKKNSALMNSLKAENTQAVDRILYLADEGKIDGPKEFRKWIKNLQDTQGSFLDATEFNRLLNRFNKGRVNNEYLNEMEWLVKRTQNESAFTKSVALYAYINNDGLDIDEQKQRLAQLAAAGYLSNDVLMYYGTLLKQPVYKEQLTKIFGEEYYQEITKHIQSLKNGK